MNALINHNKTGLVKYYHAACFSPVLSTWLKAIRQGKFSSWQGLIIDLFCKYFKKSMNTTLGHMHQQWKKLQST